MIKGEVTVMKPLIAVAGVEKGAWLHVQRPPLPRKPSDFHQALSLQWVTRCRSGTMSVPSRGRQPPAIFVSWAKYRIVVLQADGDRTRMWCRRREERVKYPGLRQK